MKPVGQKKESRNKPTHNRHCIYDINSGAEKRKKVVSTIDINCHSY